MKKTLLLLTWMMAVIQAGAITLTRVSVHDPSVVYEPSSKYYYIFGTHRGLARTMNMMSWSSATYTLGLVNDAGKVTSTTASNANSTGNTFSRFFKTNITKTVTIGGEEKTFGNFDVHAWSAAASNNYELDGNMWAPDVVYNEKMKKWCLYFSINGDSWASSIVLLTADRISGPYVYQGPVVFSGFGNTSNADLSYKKTDLELVLGEQKSLPARYNVGSKWGNRWPNCIDPCVFFDEEGKLWMTYGSWSGGIWMLELNEETGLRDYDVKYNVTGSGDGVTSDPYYGKKIAGGFYVSGEGSYIEYINGYYYLFMSYGFMLSALPDDPNAGGYQMRVFRSEKPDGPYKDSRGASAVYTQYAKNFGPNCDTRGVNIFGAYGDWGLMSLAEREQGHNSIIAAEDGRTYLVYHTRFQDGWLVAAPFEYTGETVKSADISTTQQVATENIPGTYKLMIHRYGLDYKWGNQELVTPIDITLSADGTISGDKSGTWEAVEGTSYVNLTIGGLLYKGVMVNQVMESNTTNWPSTTFTANNKNKTVAITALARSGVTAWAYRTGDDPTGISLIPAPSLVGEWSGYYTLDGRKLKGEPGKGIYIWNGKKVIK